MYWENLQTFKLTCCTLVWRCNVKNWLNSFESLFNVRNDFFAWSFKKYKWKVVCYRLVIYRVSSTIQFITEPRIDEVINLIDRWHGVNYWTITQRFSFLLTQGTTKTDDRTDSRNGDSRNKPVTTGWMARRGSLQLLPNNTRSCPLT